MAEPDASVTVPLKVDRLSCPSNGHAAIIKIATAYGAPARSLLICFMEFSWNELRIKRPRRTATHISPGDGSVKLDGASVPGWLVRRIDHNYIVPRLSRFESQPQAAHRSAHSRKHIRGPRRRSRVPILGMPEILRRQIQMNIVSARNAGSVDNLSVRIIRQQPRKPAHRYGERLPPLAIQPPHSTQCW